LTISNTNNYIEEIILDLEITSNTKFGNKQRKVIEYIATLNLKSLGVTVEKLMIQFNFKKDYAEKFIYELRSKGILKSSGIRDGHMLTYFLTNMQDYIPSPKDLDIKGNSSYQEENHFIDQDLIWGLCKLITNHPGGFHDIRLQTRLNYDDDYVRLASHGESEWTVISDRNKAKVKEVRLSLFRTAKLLVSPNGTVEIYIGASRKPYNLCKDIGLSELMADLGKIEGIFHTELSISNPLEDFMDWNIIRLDFNFDVKDLKSSYISNNSGKLQVKNLSGLYQFYVKQLPTEGLVLRLENRLSFPKPYPTINEFMNSFSKSVDHNS
jgi:hypothetical protein